MESKEITCICCPIGCQIKVELDKDKITNITGYKCKKGKEYGIEECINPVRIVTSIIKVIEGELPVVSVKTNSAISKEKIFAVVEQLKKYTLTAPVSIGEIVIENVCETGANIVTTSEVDKINDPLVNLPFLATKI